MEILPPEAPEERVAYKVCPKCRFDGPEPMEACPSCGIIYSDYVPKEKRRPAVSSAPAPPRAVSKVPLVVAAAMLAFGVYWASYFNLQRELIRARAEDDAARGIEVTVHYGGWVRSSVVVFDVRKVEARHRPADVFGLLSRFARALSDRRYARVVLSCRGSERFYLSGGDFRRLGRELGIQNPAYAVLSFPQELRLPSGARAFPAAEGEPDEIVSQQLAQVVELHRRWYRSDLGIAAPIDLDDPGAVASQLVGVDKVGSWARVSIPDEEAEPRSKAHARLAVDAVELEPPDPESRVLVRGVVRNSGHAAGCRVSLRLSVVGEDGNLIGSGHVLVTATIPPSYSEPFQGRVEVPAGSAASAYAATAVIEGFKETCR